MRGAAAKTKFVLRLEFGLNCYCILRFCERQLMPIVNGDLSVFARFGALIAKSLECLFCPAIEGVSSLSASLINLTGVRVLLVCFLYSEVD